MFFPYVQGFMFVLTPILFCLVLTLFVPNALIRVVDTARIPFLTGLCVFIGSNLVFLTLHLISSSVLPDQVLPFNFWAFIFHSL